MSTRRLLLAAVLLGAPVSAATPPPLILLAAGEPSHGPGEHRFPEGCRLLAAAITGAGLPVRAQAVEGWPAPALLEEATALVLYSDGLDRHVARGRVPELRRHTTAGRGLAVLHFALEPSPGDLADYLLATLGGRFEVGWSVNPVWNLPDPRLAPHEATRGVRPFSLEDEWYYHLRLAPGVQPLLRALPPVTTLGQDGPRSGNAAVRAALARGQPQVLAWAFTGAGARTFGFTGGHFHRNWWDVNFRTFVLNALLWTAGVAVPASGAASTLPPAPKHATLDEAIARGDLEDVQLHLRLKPAAAREARPGALAPLHQAILRNRTEIALVLLDAGASPDEPDRSRRTPLHLAVERGNLALVEALLSRRARPDARDQTGWTPLHHAAAKDRVAIARAFLRAGAPAGPLSERGGTPLHEAAASGSAEMVQLFLDAGVDPRIVSRLGVTALDIAREFRNEPAIRLLEPLVPARR